MERGTTTGMPVYKDVQLFDVYENSQMAIYIEEQELTKTNVLTCDVLRAKCKSFAEFERVVSTYLSD
jgi:hypothetical protein